VRRGAQRSATVRRGRSAVRDEGQRREGKDAGARAASVEFHLRVLALGTLAVFGAVPFTGCGSYRLYGPRTLGGASMSVPEVARLKPDQNPADVRALLGDPLSVTETPTHATWRYYELAEPRWCDGGNLLARRPRYSLELLLTFRDDRLTQAVARTSGSITPPALDPALR